MTRLLIRKRVQTMLLAPQMRQGVCLVCGAQVRKAYRDVPYHNFFHCVDVTHATYRFIALVGRAVGLTQAERLALMLAALCHDMEHPGALACTCLCNI